MLRADKGVAHLVRERMRSANEIAGRWLKLRQTDPSAVRVIARLAILGALLLPPRAVGADPLPRLSLSRTSGAAGTRVLVIGRNCTMPVAQADTLAWHDRYYRLHDIEKRPPLRVWRSIPVRRTSATTVHAVFTVLRTDHIGRGLLDLLCGSRGNATATFLVTRR